MALALRNPKCLAKGLGQEASSCFISAASRWGRKVAHSETKGRMAIDIQAAPTLSKGTLDSLLFSLLEGLSAKRKDSG